MDLLCKWCGETKPQEEMVRRNAKLPYSQSNIRNCKQCNTKKNKDRYKIPEIREKQLKANAKWRKDHPEKLALYTEEFYKRRPAQQQARNRISYLVREGRLERQPCCLCGSTEQVEAHHDSYAEHHWETVRWLCKQHHESWHSILDPVKSKILAEPMLESKRMKEEAENILIEISNLRNRYRSLMADAIMLEDAAWNKVMQESESLFNSM